MNKNPMQETPSHRHTDRKGFFSLCANMVLVCLSLSFLVACNEPAPAKENIEVRYMVVSTRPVRITTELPGRVSAFMVSEVRPQVSGIIQKRLFEEGADVREGDVLYQIDPALYEAAYHQASAALARAKANVTAARLLAERYEKIVGIQAVSRQEYDDAVAAFGVAKSEVEAARQAVETARINLDYTRVTAPVSGRIGRSFVTPGALVTQNQAEPLSTIQQLSPVYVDVTQSSMDLLKLRKAQAQGELQSGGKDAAKVRLLLEDGTAYTKSVADADPKGDRLDRVEGILQFSDVTIEQSTGVVALRAIFDNPDHILLPGMYVRALVEEGIRDDAILIPQKTVLRDTKNYAYVYVLGKDNPEKSPDDTRSPGENEFFVSMRYVTLDRDIDSNWLITEGLAPGDLVIVDGLQKVQPEQLVSGIPLVLPKHKEDAGNGGER